MESGDFAGLEEVVSRLRKIEGQVSGIRKMCADDRRCIDVLDQLSAARKGLDAVALLILETHVRASVRDAIEGGEIPAEPREMLAAIRRFVRSV